MYTEGRLPDPCKGVLTREDFPIDSGEFFKGGRSRVSNVDLKPINIRPVEVIIK
jgi:hypothetical protein